MKHHQQSLKLWEDLRDEECTQCPLHKEANTVCLLGDGPAPAAGMVIGEAPGETEDSTEIAFSGRVGIFLRKTLKEIGIDPRQLYITNVVSCRPPENRTPKRKEAVTCGTTYLDPQIAMVNPSIVLVLGNIALAHVMGRGHKITKMEGQVVKQDGRVFVFSRHPSAVLRAESSENYSNVLQTFKENLLLFKRYLHPTVETFTYKKDLPKYDPKLPVTIDIETNGLSPFRDDATIWCIGATQRDTHVSTSMLYEKVKGEWRKVKDYDKRMKYYREMIETCRVSAYRDTFEGIWLRQHVGPLLHLHSDGKVVSHLINENEQTGLKYRAQKDLGVEPWDGGINFQDPDPDDMLLYNGKDTCYEERMYNERDVPYLRAHPKQARLLKYIIIPAMEIFIDVICRGYHVDMDEANRKLKECHIHMAEQKAKLEKIAGHELNPGSPIQMKKLFYEDLGLFCPVKTSKGADSTSEAALIRLQGEHEAVDIQLEWRKWEKFRSTYLVPWIKKGPILHANYEFTDTDTGRLASSMVKNKRHEKGLGATLHQCPRDPFIRSLVTPRNRGWNIVAADLSQIELRLVAQASGDKAMTRIFNNSAMPEHSLSGHSCPDCDIHLATAMNLHTGEITKEWRKRAKAVNFGFVYGMMPKKFQAYAKEKFGLNLSMRDSERYRETFFDTYDLLPWHSRVESFVSSNGWIDSVFGRRRHLPEAHFEAGVEEWIRQRNVRQAINSPIQSAGSDLDLFICVLMMSRWLPWNFKIDRSKCYFIGAAHDSLLFECHPKYAPILKEGVEFTYKNLPTEKYFGFKFKVPILMEVDIYKDRWEGEKVKL
jgi:uracil-DNA glycosylase family 4